MYPSRLGTSVSFQVLFHIWHNGDPVWSVQCNNRVPYIFDYNYSIGIAIL